ncbi:hypothetical protein HDU93_007462 [Gonapodya sp. JEL0774]|nr:hypothetical protein HDU93_007462 [Gonapodya sp. JEL0774]
MAEFGTNEQACACRFSKLSYKDKAADKIVKLVEAAGIEMEPIWAKLFSKALEGRDLAATFTNFSSAPAGAAPTIAVPVAAAEPASAEEKKDDKKGGKPAKKEEKKEEEEDDDMGFAIKRRDHEGGGGEGACSVVWRGHGRVGTRCGSDLSRVDAVG